MDDPQTVEDGKGTLLLRYNFIRDLGQEHQDMPFQRRCSTSACPQSSSSPSTRAFLRPESSAGPDPGMSAICWNVGLKWRFLEQDGAVPAIALDYTLSLPTGGPGLSADTVVHSPFLTLGWQLDGHFLGRSSATSGANVSQQRPRAARSFSPGWPSAFRRPQPWLVGVGGPGQHARQRHLCCSDLSIGLATQFDLSDSWTIMARVGRSISGTQKLNAYVGFQTQLLSSAIVALQQRSPQDHHRRREIDDQSRHVHQRRHERRADRGRIQPAEPQDKRQHAPHERSPQHHAGQ